MFASAKIFTLLEADIFFSSTIKLFIVDEKNMSTSNKVKILAEANKVFDHFGAVLGVFQSDADYFFVSDKEIELRKRGLSIRRLGI